MLNNNNKYEIMTQKEFEERTGIVPTPEDFEYIHEMYMNTSMDKDAFCKEFKKHISFSRRKKSSFNFKQNS